MQTFPDSHVSGSGATLQPSAGMHSFRLPCFGFRRNGSAFRRNAHVFPTPMFGFGANASVFRRKPQVFRLPRFPFRRKASVFRRDAQVSDSNVLFSDGMPQSSGDRSLFFESTLFASDGMQTLSDGMRTPFDSHFIAARSRVKPSASHNHAPRSCVAASGPCVKCYGHHRDCSGPDILSPSAAFFHYDSTLFALGPAFFVPGESVLRRRPALNGCEAAFGHTRNASQIPHLARLPRTTTFLVHHAAFFARGATFLSYDTTTNAPGRVLFHQGRAFKRSGRTFF